MAATTEWVTSAPTKTGSYIVEYIGDWFPEGDSNNITYFIADVVVDDTGKLRVLRAGGFLDPSSYKGWRWAYILGT